MLKFKDIPNTDVKCKDIPNTDFKMYRYTR